MMDRQRRLVLGVGILGEGRGGEKEKRKKKKKELRGSEMGSGTA